MFLHSRRHRNLERDRNFPRHCAQEARQVKTAFAGNQPLGTCGMEQPFERSGMTNRRVAQVEIAKIGRGSAELRKSSIGPGQMQRIHQNACVQCP